MNAQTSDVNEVIAPESDAVAEDATVTGSVPDGSDVEGYRAIDAIDPEAEELAAAFIEAFAGDEIVDIEKRQRGGWGCTRCHQSMGWCNDVYVSNPCAQQSPLGNELRLLTAKSTPAGSVRAATSSSAT